MISNVTSYQDRSFARPITPALEQDFCFADHEYLGGEATIEVTAEYRFDSGCLEMDDDDDIRLNYLSLHFPDGAYFVWQEGDIGRMKQWRVNEIVSLVEQQVREQLVGMVSVHHVVKE